MTLNRTFITTAALTALRRMLATAASATVSNVVWMIGTKGRPGRSNCSNENIMVCLPDQRSTDRLATFSRRRRLLSVSIDQLDKCGCTAYLHERNSLSYPPTASLGISFLSTTPSRSKAPRAFDWTRACTRRARPYYTSLRNTDQPRPGHGDAELGLARASHILLLPPYHEPLRLHLR